MNIILHIRAVLDSIWRVAGQEPWANLFRDVVVPSYDDIQLNSRDDDDDDDDENERNKSLLLHTQDGRIGDAWLR